MEFFAQTSTTGTATQIRYRSLLIHTDFNFRSVFIRVDPSLT